MFHFVARDGRIFLPVIYKTWIKKQREEEKEKKKRIISHIIEYNELEKKAKDRKKKRRKEVTLGLKNTLASPSLD